MFFKLAILIAIQIFVLISAIFLMIYTNKQQAGKWYSYASGAIVIGILVMMICTTFGAVVVHKMQHDNRMMEHCGYHDRMMNGNCEHHGMECEEGDEGCGMDEQCKHSCEKEMGEEHCMKKEIIITTNDSLPKKEIIIKKK